MDYSYVKNKSTYLVRRGRLIHLSETDIKKNKKIYRLEWLKQMGRNRLLGRKKKTV